MANEWWSSVSEGGQVAYAAMAPRETAPATVLRKRQRGFEVGQTCTHWPFDFTCLSPPESAGAVGSFSQWALLCLTLRALQANEHRD